MGILLIATFFTMFSTSLQKESPDDVSPAEIFLGKPRVKEGQEVRFKCKVVDVRTRRVYVLLCKNGATVKTAELEQSKDDIEFLIDKVTVEDSGLYTCSYAVEEHAACGNVTGRNSIALEVVGEILPAKITAAQSSLRQGEDLTLTCSTTVNQSCAEVYVYLCLNGIGKISRTVTCSINLTTETFLLTNVKQEDSGNYSCVYSTSNHSLSEVIKTGRNTVHIQVHGFLLQNAAIQSPRTNVAKGEDIELTCSISEYVEPSTLHMYLLKNGDNKLSNALYNKNHTRFSIKNVTQEDAGIYSCVYTSKTYGTREADGQRSILIRVYDPQWQINFIRVLISGGVIIFACMIVIFDIRTSR